MKSYEIKLNNVSFTIPRLSSYGYNIGVHKWKREEHKDHFIVKTVHSTFDKNLYGFPHTPIMIDHIYDTAKFSKNNDIRVLDMPIKFPGFNEYRIPQELKQFDELISKIVAFEHFINPFVSEHYYAYLTVDQSFVQAGKTQRNEGCHVDGFQGSRITNKRPINRSYIAYNIIPPIFYAQPFITSHLDEKTDNFFLSFDEQAEKESEIIFDPFQIVLMNAYSVHKSDKAKISSYRTFFRLSFDTMIYDRYGNTHNPMFDYSWAMSIRNAQTKLRHKKLYV